MRLDEAKLRGRQFYRSLDDSFKELPVDLNKIISSNPSWSKYEGCLYGEDGYTLYKNRNGKTAYKICVESFKDYGRKRFTIAHEIGHIALGHFEKYYLKPLSDYEEYALDQEANMFAGELLMPYDYMVEYYRWSIKSLRYKFHVSEDAARTRLSVLNDDYMFLRELKGLKNNSISRHLKVITDHYKQFN